MLKIQLKNGETVVIREAVVDDAEGLIQHINTIAGESDFVTFGPGEFEITVEKEKEILEAYSKADNKIFLVAEVNEEIIGCITFGGGGRARTKHVGEFGLSIQQRYWGQGVGTKLLENLIDWAKDTGIVRKINLRVRSDNERGIKLYAKMGFVKEGLITRDMYTHGEFYDSTQMGLQID